MRSLLIAMAVTGACICPCFDTAQQVLSGQSVQAADDMTFYRVPLMCTAARGLGCGSRAKPVLLDLQKRPNVEEAWLNRAGDIMAVVWKPGTDPASRQSAITAVTESYAVSISELDADARATALAGFRSGTGWHQGAEVDRLSEQEARVISDRLLGRVVSKRPSVEAKKAVVGPALTETIRRLLVEACMSPSQCRDALLAAARKHLDKGELTALRDAIDVGFTPVGGER